MLDDAVWPGKELAHWRNLTGWIEEAVSQVGSGRTVLYRGQPQRWSLRPTLLRALPPIASAQEATQAERNALEHFKSQVHLHEPRAFPRFDGKSPEVLEWWALMQHHQAPTRLLDWTASPYVAAYFAAERDFTEPGVILVIDGGQARAHFDTCHHGVSLDEAFFQDPRTSPGVRTYTTPIKTARLVAQQGYFTVSARVLDEHDSPLQRAGAIIGQWIIPAHLKLSLLTELRTTNVSAVTLFPGLDGLGRSTTEIIRTATLSIGAA